MTFNTALDSTAHWNVGTDTRIRYNNFVSYVAQQQADAAKNTTRTTNFNERISVGYRNDWLEVTLDGRLNYQHSRNELQPSADLDTWQFNYGGQFLIKLPYDFEISSELHERSRRGYNDSSMNTNELIWNGQISKPFLKSKSLIVALNFTICLVSRATMNAGSTHQVAAIPASIASTHMQCFMCATA